MLNIIQKIHVSTIKKYIDCQNMVNDFGFNLLLLEDEDIFEENEIEEENEKTYFFSISNEEKSLFASENIEDIRIFLNGVMEGRK